MNDKVPSDLVDRCTSGDPNAWEELYARCHEALEKSIIRWLPAGWRNPDLVEEIAARVWYELVREDAARLRQFDPAKGELIHFLAGVARNVILVHCRSERRRRLREARVAMGREIATEGSPHLAATLDEFPATLTRAERLFFADYLGERGADADSGLAPLVYRRRVSRSNARQLLHRVRTKLRTFLDSR